MFELTSMLAVKLTSRSVRLVEMQPDGSVMMIILRESPSATKNEGFVASLMLGGQSDQRSVLLHGEMQSAVVSVPRAWA